MVSEASRIDRPSRRRPEDVRDVCLVDAGIASLAALEDLPLFVNLQSLSLHSNRIERIECLASLPRLRHLDLSSNRIESSLGIAACAGLVSLSLASNRLSTFDGLRPLVLLERLDLSYNRLDTLAFFMDVTPQHSLVSVCLRGNALPPSCDLTPLALASTLRQLELAGCPLASDTPLRLYRDDIFQHASSTLEVLDGRPRPRKKGKGCASGSSRRREPSVATDTPHIDAVLDGKRKCAPEDAAIVVGVSVCVQTEANNVGTEEKGTETEQRRVSANATQTDDMDCVFRRTEATQTDETGDERAREETRVSDSLRAQLRELQGEREEQVRAVRRVRENAEERARVMLEQQEGTEEELRRLRRELIEARREIGEAVERGGEVEKRYGVEAEAQRRAHSELKAFLEGKLTVCESERAALVAEVTAMRVVVGERTRDCDQLRLSVETEREQVGRLRTETERLMAVDADRRVQLEEGLTRARHATGLVRELGELVREQKEQIRTQTEKIRLGEERLRRAEQQSERVRSVQEELASSRRREEELQRRLVAQDSVCEGLRAERAQWSRELAVQGATLARDHGTVERERDALRERIGALEMEVKGLRDAVRVKEVMVEEAQRAVGEMRERIGQTEGLGERVRRAEAEGERLRRERNEVRAEVERLKEMGVREAPSDVEKLKETLRAREAAVEFVKEEIERLRRECGEREETERQQRDAMEKRLRVAERTSDKEQQLRVALESELEHARAQLNTAVSAVRDNERGIRDIMSQREKERQENRARINLLENTLAERQRAFAAAVNAMQSI